jgi:hypothetical protein
MPARAAEAPDNRQFTGAVTKVLPKRVGNLVAPPARGWHPASVALGKARGSALGGMVAR